MTLAPSQETQADDPGGGGVVKGRGGADEGYNAQGYGTLPGAVGYYVGGILSCAGVRH